MSKAKTSKAAKGSMAGPTKATKSAEEPDSKSAKKAFDRCAPALAALAESEVMTPNVDAQAAAVVALGAFELLAKPDARKKIMAMAKGDVVALPMLDGLRDAAWATWYARHRLLQADATHSGAALPVLLVDDAMQIRARMLKTLEYHLEGDSDAMAMVSGIRSGGGHLDLANDLAALADMYEKHKAALASDTKNYRKADAKAARKASITILKLLGANESTEQEKWRDAQARSFTLLVRHYDEAMRVGRFLYHRQGGDRLFPNLLAATRASTNTKQAKTRGKGSSGEDGGADSSADENEAEPEMP